MPKNLSAIKKTRISSRNRARNKMYKSSIKTLTKKYLLSLKEAKDRNMSQDKLSNVYKKLDKAVKKGVVHKNYAARKKSLLARVMKNIFIS